MLLGFLKPSIVIVTVPGLLLLRLKAPEIVIAVRLVLQLSAAVSVPLIPLQLTFVKGIVIYEGGVTLIVMFYI